MEKQNEVRADLNKALSENEYNTIVDVLKRFDGECVIDYDGDSIFRFANYSGNGFLKELPIVVDILAKNRNVSNFDYNGFVRSLKFVAEILTEISEWRFCLMPLSAMCDAISKENIRRIKAGEA